VVDDMVASARAGTKSSLARLVTWVERGGGAARIVGRVVHAQSTGAATIGMTGAPGSGKSTLTSALCGCVRDRGERIGVLAIDPSSPFSGGAILGDRIRMGDHVLDDGVFIRSMATRGHLGGLALATPAAVRVLDAAGLDWIVVETVGVGQVEVEIAGAADTVIVVVNPGWGDAVQAAKAGLMEIADIFVINKADRPGAGQARADLDQMLSLSNRSMWRPPIVATVATDGTGISELMDAVGAHRDHLVDSGELLVRRRARVRSELVAILSAELAERARTVGGGESFEELVDSIADLRVDPWSAAEQLLSVS